ncbi:hypothetical protein HELRODRAFT_170481 [Helobdella robusta]|uniref:Immunoglobulin domain-containing protein n=1 Tax=Helobdella robusta TaxID=6412 RepID=T1F340_HELRO|nr:hypothetical protein HELRODRAFT_170481 [Helobdella robusta]ESO07171.1 hypothetical protein HELRODRAFT_170481 [Helobdella robusta]
MINVRHTLLGLLSIIAVCLVSCQNDNVSGKNIPEKEKDKVELAAFNFSVLEAKRTVCARQEENVWLHCVPEWISREVENNLQSQIIEGFWKSETGHKLPGPLEPRRFQIDKRYRLLILDAKSIDTGTYTCTIILKSKKLKTSTVRLTVYELPMFGMEFPLVFRLNGSCTKHKRLVEASLNEMQGLLCGFRERLDAAQPVCQFNVHDVACRRVTLHTMIENNEPEVFLEITVRKLPHPKFKSPRCSEECMKNYFSLHINSNLEQMIKQLLTMRQYFHVCPRGFRLRKNCRNRGSICLPCSPGTFSENGLINYCNKCPVDTYQSFYGSKSCMPCDSSQGTGTKKGSIQAEDCRTHQSYPKYSVTLTYSLVLLTIASSLALFGITVAMLEGWCPMNMGKRLINEMERRKSRKQAQFIAKLREKAHKRLIINKSKSDESKSKEVLQKAEEISRGSFKDSKTFTTRAPTPAKNINTSTTLAT